MTVQDVVNGVSTDARTMLQNSGSDALIVNDWVDRIQKDILRDSVYKNLNRSLTQATTIADQNYVTLSPTNIRQVLLVYDRSTDRFLDSYEGVLALGKQTPPSNVMEILQGSTKSSLPELWKFAGPSTLTLFPGPQAAYALDVHYENLVPSVNGNLSATLIVPDDGRDMMVAGVNYLCETYLGREQQVQFWAGLYNRLKMGENYNLQLMPPQMAPQGQQ